MVIVTQGSSEIGELEAIRDGSFSKSLLVYRAIVSQLLKAAGARRAAGMVPGATHARSLTAQSCLPC